MSETKAMTETSDAGEILKKHHGEVPAETRRELEADDLHERLAAACEWLGIEPYIHPTRFTIPRPIPDLLAALEAWLSHPQRLLIWIREVMAVLEIHQDTFTEKVVIAVLSMTEAQRRAAAIAAADKLEGKG